MLENVNQNVIELVNDSFLETPFTKKIQNVFWLPEVSLVTFKKNTSMITPDECEYEVIKKLAA
jgi:hypothetical protein